MLEFLKPKTNKLEKLFNPKSIAIVGASEEAGKIGNVLVKNITGLGYKGRVYYVNPAHDQVLGERSYVSLAKIETDVDLAIVAIPAKFVNETILEAADKVKNFVVISAGFSEIGEEGKKREEELKKIAKEKELNIFGPNCLGFIFPALKLNASFAGGMPETGGVAFVSQSGALAVALMDIAKKENIGFSKIISIGNKMQIGEAELLEYLEEDDDTKVIAMYLEGISDGQRFMEVAAKVKKPVVVLKSGKTEKAQKAISSHTGALAGSDDIMTAAFEKAGILRAKNMEEFFGLISLVSVAGAPENEKVAVITNAGGPGVLTTDAFLGKELRPTDFSERTKSKLREFLPMESSVENPVDLLGDADEKRYEKALAMIDDEEIGSVVCVLTPQDQTPVDKIAEKIITFKNKTKKTVVAAFIGGERIEKADDVLEAAGVPSFVFPEEAVRALDDYYKWKKSKKQQVAELEADESRKHKAGEIIGKAKAGNRSALLFSEAAEICALYGINVIKHFTPDSAKEEIVYGGLKFPVVVKVDSDKVLHKTDRKGLILGVTDEESLKASLAEIKNNFPGENIIIQPMLERNMEVIIGIKQDPIFGPVIVCGLGGIYTEVFKMADFLIPPLDIESIKEKLVNGKLAFLFQRTRGQAPYGLEDVVKILEGVQKMALENPEVKEFDINPLLAYNDGRPAVAVDVKIVI